MSQLGLGAMLHYLGGGSPHSASEFVGQVIKGAIIEDDVLKLSLQNGGVVSLSDKGQSCCEHRHMTCDDEMSNIIGHTITAIEAKEGPDTEEEYGEMHETCFVEVQTDGGFITLTNHNEHNGYYGGFGLSLDYSGPALTSEPSSLD